jgi:hypothetical protein
MLIFFIHGVGTKNANYANNLVKNINQNFIRTEQETEALFYSSFWGNLFNNKKSQTINFIEKDVVEAISKHKIPKWLQKDVYRYKERRFQFINEFLGDFLIYQNPLRGQSIRDIVIQQFLQFVEDHPQKNEVHLVAHSLGCLILWDLLFSQELKNDEKVSYFRQRMSKLGLESITTLGSPLLFIKQFLDIDFSPLSSFVDANKTFDGEYALRWINVIHSSDVIAYPMTSAIQNEVSQKLFFTDQYVWLNSNKVEPVLRSLGNHDEAMITAASDAHSSYLSKNLDGAITGDIIARNILGKTKELEEIRITSWDKSLYR